MRRLLILTAAIFAISAPAAAAQAPTRRQAQHAIGRTWNGHRFQFDWCNDEHYGVMCLSRARLQQRINNGPWTNAGWVYSLDWATSTRGLVTVHNLRGWMRFGFSATA